MELECRKCRSKGGAEVAVTNRIRKVLKVGINGSFFRVTNYFQKFIFIASHVSILWT